MKRCDPNVRAKCPDGKNCELYAEFADGSECDKFNEQLLNQPMTNADRIRAMSDENLAAQFTQVFCEGFTASTDILVPAELQGEIMAQFLEKLQQPAGEV